MTGIHVGICAVGQRLAAARVLAESIGRVRPDWPITVLFIPAGEAVQLHEDEPFEVLELDYLDDAGLLRALAMTPYVRQARLAGPALAQRLLDSGADAVVYLAPETLMISEPRELEELLDAHAAVVVPRLTGTLPHDLERPDASDLAAAGELDDGIFAVRNTAAGRGFADWWAQQARENATVLSLVASTGARAPRLIGATPPVAAARACADVAVLEHPGYSVSAWNLQERPLSRGADGALSAGDGALRIARFTGFDAARPWWLADFATRIRVLADPVLESLCGAYSEQLIAAGDSAPPSDLHGSAQPVIANLIRYDLRLRRLHQVAVVEGEDFGDLYTAAGAEQFAAWLTEPAQFGAVHGVNRYLHDAWQGRVDLGEAFSDLDQAEQAEGLIDWAWMHGRQELDLQDRLLPPRPGDEGPMPSDPPAVLVSGYLRGVVGLGAAARGYVDALEAGGVPLVSHVLPTEPPETRVDGRRVRGELADFADRTLPAGIEPEIHLLCVNADQAADALAEVPLPAGPLYTIGLWAWETDVIPDRWRFSYPLVDELWVYSTWIAENIAAAAPLPVVVMPIPVSAPEVGQAPVPIELPDAFRFLFAFDLFSTTERKNPEAVVEAFTRAFAPGEGPVLVLKTMNAELRPADFALVEQAAGGRPDVVIFDGVISEAERAALFAACDCYVSLHRAEGFGMTLAEAMALAKPVIATGWSGNMDFTTAHNSYLVDYLPRLVGPGNPPYSSQGTWAEPSVEHAAALMREVWENQEEARRRGARAQRDVMLNLSAATVGERARGRLNRIARLAAGDGTQRVAPSVEVELTRARAKLGFDRAGAGLDGRRGRAARAVLDLLRPYTGAQRDLDVELVTAVETLASSVEWLREGRVRDQKRIRELERQLSQRR